MTVTVRLSFDGCDGSGGDVVDNGDGDGLCYYELLIKLSHSKECQQICSICFYFIHFVFLIVLLKSRQRNNSIRDPEMN